MANKNKRDFGLGDCPPAALVSLPTWQKVSPPLACPDCTVEIVVVSVRVAVPQLHGGIGTGQYLGCCACAWVSPMLVVSDRAPASPHVPAELLRFATALKPPETQGHPACTWASVSGTNCPKCKCTPLMRVTHKNNGHAFFGCPACSWLGIVAGQATLD